MLLRRLKITAPAKVNLYLSVKGERADGYHDLETVFHTLDLADTLIFEEHDAADGLPDFSISGDTEDIPLKDNLIWRAYDAFEQHSGAAPIGIGHRLRVEVRKSIPARAGLGGGSSDAAAALLACSTFAGTDPRSMLCLHTAARLGADVPFFLYGGCAYMTGKGEMLERRLTPLSLPVLLTDTGEGVSTQEAYRAFDSDPQAFRSAKAMVDMLADIETSSERELPKMLDNNLERAACAISGSVSEQLAWLKSQPGITAALVCGSGSACFALCEDEETCSALAKVALNRGYWACPTSLASPGAKIVSDERF